MRTEWNTFKGGVWRREINVRDFIQKNYTPMTAATSFWKVLPEYNGALGPGHELSKKEQEAGESWIWIPKSFPLSSHGPGYLNKDKETIVGFQTDKPFKRSFSLTEVSAWL